MIIRAPSTCRLGKRAAVAQAPAKDGTSRFRLSGNFAIGLSARKKNVLCRPKDAAAWLHGESCVGLSQRETAVRIVRTDDFLALP